MTDTDQLYELDQLIGNFNQFAINNDKNNNISRQPGLFKKVLMQWECKSQTLFQFKQMFTHRLQTLRKVFNINLKNTIQDVNNDSRISQLIGLFKRIEAKRVRAFQEGYTEKYQNHRQVYSQNDTYQLEDQTGKVKLQFRNNTKINGESRFNALDVPYGIIIKCKGQYNPRLNRFIVSNIQTPNPAPQSKFIPLIGSPKYMVVVNEPTIQDIQNILSCVSNSIQKSNLSMDQLVIIGGINYLDIQQIRRFDQLLCQLGAIIDVFIIPSSNQQTSLLFPQPPLHQNMLRKSYTHKNVSNCSSPQLLNYKNQNENINLSALISCGQNLLNLKANCNVHDDLQLMKMIIQYRHICPSSIFSLPIQSYECDPLILYETPHLMISGKCQMFSTDFYERQNGKNFIQTRLVALSKGDMARIDLTSQTFETKKFILQTYKK